MVTCPSAARARQTQTPESMLRDADLAMHRAKQPGRGRFAVFDQELHRSALQLLELETELRRAAGGLPSEPSPETMAPSVCGRRAGRIAQEGSTPRR